MAKSKLIVPDFIKVGQSRGKSTDLTDEGLSSVDVGRDFVPATLQSKVHPNIATNTVNVKTRND